MYGHFAGVLLMKRRKVSTVAIVVVVSAVVMVNVVVVVVVFGVIRYGMITIVIGRKYIMIVIQ